MATGRWDSDVLTLADGVDVLVGDSNGAYPFANSLVVSGTGETVIIDPSVSVARAGGAHRPIDAVLNSHSHEDHVAGNGVFPGSRVLVHHLDRPGVASLDDLMASYGLAGDVEARLRTEIVEQFHYAPRPDAIGFGDGARFDLGGIAVEAVHLPGHTAGHCGFRVGADVFYLSDIDLTGFGPYYGDVSSSLDDFESSLALAREVDARWYVTSHHKGVVEGPERFREMIDAFAAVIGRRHAAMLEYLTEPRTIDEMTAHRFVYRPHVEAPFVDAVERRSAELHIDRMLARGEAVEAEPGLYRSASRS